MRISTSSESGIGGKIIATIFGLVFAAFGLFFVNMAWQGIGEAQSMKTWIETSCTVLSSQMHDTGENYELTLEYSYTFNGQSYTAERYSNNRYYTSESATEIDRMQKNFPEGKQTVCHVNPNNPAEAVFRLPSVKSAITGFGFTLLFPAFGLFFASLPWLFRRKTKGSRFSTAETDPNPSNKKGVSNHGKTALILFGSIFVLAGMLAFYPLAIKPMQKAKAAKTWPSVPATVVSSKIKSHDSDDGTTYSIYVAYRYEIGGKEFVGDRYSFIGGSSSGYESKAAVVRQYPEGHQFSVFVNPADPFDSVIKRDLGKGALFGLIPVVFFIVGVGIVIGGFRVKKPQLDPQQAKEHIITLQGTSPAKKATSLIIFTLIWNGIVYAIFQSDAPIFFHIVFGVVGVIMIGVSIHAILAIFNPRPTVQLNPGNIHPGTNVAMRWRTNGNVDRIATLTITLQCQHITTETRRSGGETKTSTVKTPIFTEQLHRTDSQLEIAQGTLQFHIPENQPASRPGDEDGIQWLLILKGDIPRWPDMKTELPFTVYPDE